MRQKQKSFFISYLWAGIFICFFSVQAQALVFVPINHTFQEKPVWCWNACVKTILEYYNQKVTQKEIADWAVGGQAVCDFFYGNCSGRKSIEAILNHFGIDTQRYTRPLTFEELTGLFDAQKAVIIRWSLGNNQGHFVVLHGYVPKTDSIFVMDPQEPIDHTWKYDSVVKDNEHVWTNSLAITTLPPHKNGTHKLPG